MSEHVESTVNKAEKGAWLFIAWNVIFFVAALILKDTVDSDTADTILIRGGVWAVGGFILLYLLSQMKKGQRSGWLRLSIISVLAPLGALAFVVFTPHLPLWFDIAQLGGALFLIYIAFLVLHKTTRSQFPKK